ncbi:hypothetical protein L6164_032495 [Bauhinia variegata]|uniref:Uncharacterized protein n=1 Tax=Bauhinia variegata TaxID=167791 RepID=A0ACB9KP88_BAUVA|nr:hypothetical protein L6164_032495 [Bauhinia variegata]
MDMDLEPRTSQLMAEAEGGGYYTWSSSKFPLLAKTNVAAGYLVLRPGGFALPHYADSSKVGCVLQGTDGVVGMVLPNTRKEVVLKLKKGDVLPVPLGTASWWFNKGDSDLIISFLGETSKAQIPGQFSYFLLAGTQGLMGGFSTEVTSKAYNLSKEDTEKLTKSQKGVLIIKLPRDQPMPIPQMDKTKELVYNIDAANPDNVVKNGGLITTVTEEEFPFVGQVGVSVIRVKLEPNAIKVPVYPANTAIQLIYIARGNGKIEIVGLNGERELDTEVNAGHLLVVPQFFVLAVIAGGEGIEYYSMVTTKKPVFEELAGNFSIWEAISPKVQQVALNVDEEFQKLFLSKIRNTTDLIPPKN